MSHAWLTNVAITRNFDHVGITVPDVKAASLFLERAFGPEAIYDNLTLADPFFAGLEAERQLGLAEGAAILRMRMQRLGEGAC